MRPALRDILLADRLYPGAYFAADFTKRKYRLGGQRYSRFLDIPSASFSRASTGYAANAIGGLVNYASGDPRQVDDRGLLVEGARTNLLLYSQQIDDANWTKVGGAISANSIAAPDGTTTADKFTEDSSTGLHRSYQAASTSSGQTHTASVYVKAGTRTYCVFGFVNVTGGPYINVNLNTGTITFAHASITASGIEALANGWYRIWASVVTTAASCGASLYQTASDYVTSYTGDGASYIYLWQGQIEMAAGASSPILTTTASATRAADLPAITGVSIPYPCTMVAKVSLAYTAAANARILHIDNNTSNERAFIGMNTSNQFNVQQIAGGSLVAGLNAGGAAAANGVSRSIAARFGLDSVQACSQGTLGTEDTSAAAPSTATVIRIGTDNSGANPWTGYVEQLAIYPTKFTDAQLQAAAP